MNISRSTTTAFHLTCHLYIYGTWDAEEWLFQASLLAMPRLQRVDRPGSRGSSRYKVTKKWKLHWIQKLHKVHIEYIEWQRMCWIWPGHVPSHPVHQVGSAQGHSWSSSARFLEELHRQGEADELPGEPWWIVVGSLMNGSSPSIFCIKIMEIMGPKKKEGLMQCQSMQPSVHAKGKILGSCPLKCLQHSHNRDWTQQFWRWILVSARSLGAGNGKMLWNFSAGPFMGSWMPQRSHGTRWL